MFMVMVRFTACTGAIERRRLNHRHHRSSRSGWGSESVVGRSVRKRSTWKWKASSDVVIFDIHVEGK